LSAFLKPNPLGIGELGFVGFFEFIYSNEQLGSLSVNLAHQLSFLDSLVV